MGLGSLLGLKKKDKASKGIGALLPMPAAGRVNPEYQHEVNGNHHGVDWTGALPQNVMQRIFEYVCPHTMDESYESSEASALEDSCMLCDMRDLAHCVLVCKRWRKYAVPVLYRSIRIDAVHYCAREDDLSEKRKKSKFGRNADPGDPSVARMSLLCRTLRDDQLGLGSCILILKTPYMLRESCKADLARIAAVAPNLRYADLPEGFFSGDASSITLRQEIENRCPDIRKMTYNAGSEKAIENLATGAVWNSLEVLELNRLSLDPSTLRYVFGALQNLQALKVKDMPIFTDQMFAPSTQIPPFPPVIQLSIEGCPNVTARGLESYLLNPTVAVTLNTLDLKRTGVQAWDVHAILAKGRKLQHFSIVETVEKPFPTHLNTPPLQSRSLSTMHFEITAEPSATYTAGTGAYYTYLATSLLANGLPNLRQLYVRDADFPEALVEFIPPMPGFMADGPAPFKPSGTGGNRFSTASITSNYTHNFGSSPPNKSGFQASGMGLPGSPENKQGSFAPSSFSPPKLNQARGQSQQNQQRQQMQVLPPTQGLKYPLEVFTKGLDEMEWNFSRIQPSQAHGRKASMSGLRPISQYGLEASGGRMSGVWGGGAASGVRSSVIVPNGFGGVLAIPGVDDKKESKTGNNVKRSKMDMDLF